MSTACRLQFVAVLICKFAPDAADANIIDTLCLLILQGGDDRWCRYPSHTKYVQPVVMMWHCGEAKWERQVSWRWAHVFRKNGKNRCCPSLQICRRCCRVVGSVEGVLWWRLLEVRSHHVEQHQDFGRRRRSIQLCPFLACLAQNWIC